MMDGVSVWLIIITLSFLFPDLIQLLNRIINTTMINFFDTTSFTLHLWSLISQLDWIPAKPIKPFPYK